MSSFYERVLYELRERQKVYEKIVLSGNLLFEDYKFGTGKIIGLMEAEDALKDAYKAMFANKANVVEETENDE